MAILFPALAVLAMPLSYVGAADLLSVSQWESKYSISTTDRQAMRLAVTGDNGDIYPLGLYIDGATAMWRATGKTVYLDQALKFVETAISTAVPSSQIASSSWKTSVTSEYLSWPGFGGVDGGYAKGNEFPLHESYGWRYVTALLRAMRETPSVYDNSEYRTRYDAILAFTEKNIWEKWYRRGVNSHLYRSNAHMASHWAFIAMNLYAITSDETKRPQYKTVWENIDHVGMPNFSGTSLRKHLIDHPLVPGGVFWTSFWNDYKLASSSDTSHASAVVSYTLASMEYGNTDWMPTDVDKFIKTYEFVWPSAGVYIGYLNGSGTYPGNANDGWIKLGRYDPRLQQRIQGITVATGAQYSGNGALNAKYLLEDATYGGVTVDAPSNVAVSNVSTSSATITWVASTGSGVSVYEIYRDNFLVGTVAANKTSFQDNSLSQGIAYTYRVRARNTGGYVSVLVGPAVAKTPFAPTATLSADTYTVIAGQSSTLTWSSQHASECTGTGFATASATSGTLVVTPAQTTTYTLSCSGAGGVTSTSSTITVIPLLIVSASATPITGNVPLDVNFESTVAGGEGGYAYQWQFGDGDASTAPNPSHTYTLAGTYTISVEVTSGAQTKTATTSIVVLPPKPTADITATPALIVHGEQTTLTWSSQHASECTGTGFATASATSGTLVVTPAQTTTYTLSCTGAGGTTQTSVSVDVIPTLVVDISSQLTSGTTPLTVAFTTTATGGTSAYTYKTDFGDGQTSASPNPSHTYTVPGTYAVTLEVISGTQTKTATTTVTVAAPKPTATLTASPTSIVAGQSATLTWSSQHASECTGTGFETASATSGTLAVTPAQTTTYTLSCSGAGGTVNASATVTVLPATRKTVFSDGFESSLNWVKTGTPTWYTGSPKNGNYSVRLRTNDSITKSISLRGYKNVVVSFSMGAYSLGYTEDFQALYYNGRSWVVLADINQGTANENNKLNPYTITLPASVNNLSSFQIRFKLNADSTSDYGFVDDVSVTAI